MGGVVRSRLPAPVGASVSPGEAATVSPTRLLLATRRVVLLLVIAASASLAGVFVHGQLNIGLFFDFEGTVVRPLELVLDGRNPYPPPVFEAVNTGNPAVYPPLSFLLFLPLVALPFEAAASIWTIGLLLCAAGALVVMGVRDWRLYVLGLTSFPVVGGVVFGNLTIALVLGAAFAWRIRRKPVSLGVVVGLLVALKLFLWPLLLWLALTGRFRSGATAVATVIATVAASWAIIGFAGLAEYPELLRVLEDVFAEHTPSLHTVVSSFWASGDLVLAGLVAASVGACCAARFASQRARDRRTFGMALLAALVASPVVWPHYYALLLVLLPLAARRRSAAWLVLPATWLAAFLTPDETAWAAPCCRPSHVPEELWLMLHSPPPVWEGVAFTLLAVIAMCAVVRARPAMHAVGERLGDPGVPGTAPATG